MDHLDAPKPGPTPESWPLALPSAAARPLSPPMLPSFEPGEPGESGRSPLWRTMLRATRRYWWQAALLWIVSTATLVVLIYTQIKPSYEAFALLRIESPIPSILVGDNLFDSKASGTSRKETQVQLITSPAVLSAALQDPQVSRLPRIRQALDAEAELREHVRSMGRPNTNLIEVAMTSTDPREAAAIVNAVVDAYLESVQFQNTQQFREWIDDFDLLRQDYEREVRQSKNRLMELVNRSSLAIANAPVGETETRVRSPEELRSSAFEVTIEEYRGLSQQLRGLDDQIWLAKRDLARLRAEQSSTGTQAAAGDDLEGLVRAALDKDPELLALRRAYEDAVGRYEIVQTRTRKANDPARRHIEQEIEGIRSRYAELNPRREAEVRERLRLEARTGQGPAALARHPIRQAERELEQLQERRELLEERLQAVRVQGQDDREKALEQEFTRVDYNIAQKKLETVELYLDQLKFDFGRNKPQISRNAEEVSFRTASDKRTKLLALAPVGMLVLVLGLFTLLEAQAARVADPDDLPHRVRLGVIGVVPPLPSPRGPLGRSNSPAKVQRQVEEFVQSLDHLRVILCSSGRPGVGEGRRVVLITSACGSEGKTTLAAQLAGRCANAGLSTLLIDADLRRPRLAELLEVPDGLGLADILAGEAEPEAAMVVIGSAGGFHLLPAGSTGHDPSRLLQGERLEQLMARLRATFDVVIVDAPPVLAVPDALLIGRWVDGAILAVRHDASRFPLVERANRRLAAIGIPVLGAVVNGARSPDVAYGSYGQSYSYSYSYARTSGDRDVIDENER